EPDLRHADAVRTPVGWIRLSLSRELGNDRLHLARSRDGRSWAPRRPPRSLRSRYHSNAMPSGIQAPKDVGPRRSRDADTIPIFRVVRPGTGSRGLVGDTIQLALVGNSVVARASSPCPGRGSWAGSPCHNREATSFPT